MEYSVYQAFCKTTESVPETITTDIGRLESAVNLSIVSSKLLDLVKKNAFYSKPIDETKWSSLLRELNLILNDANEDQRKHLSGYRLDPQPINFDTRLGHSIIGLSTETGELLESFHATAFGGKEFDVVNFGEELGDLQWYTAIGVDAGRLDFDGILQTNKTKLEARYASGKFTSVEANDRNLTVERQILQDGIGANPNEGIVVTDDVLDEVASVADEMLP